MALHGTAWLDLHPLERAAVTHLRELLSADFSGRDFSDYGDEVFVRALRARQGNLDKAHQLLTKRRHRAKARPPGESLGETPA